MGKLVFKEPTSANHILIDRAGNFHVILPIVSGCTIGMDNTCQSTRALQDFFIENLRGRRNKSIFSILSAYKCALIADLELLKENNLQNTSPYHQKLMRLGQLDCYSALLHHTVLAVITEARLTQQLGLRGIAIDLQQALWYYPAFLSTMMVQSKNLFAIHLDLKVPYGNLRTINPTFKSSGKLGYDLRKNFAEDQTVKESLAQLVEQFDSKGKIKNLIESKFPGGHFNFNDLITYITEQLSLVSKTGAVDLAKTAKGNILDEDHVKTVLGLDEITAIDVFDFIAHDCIAPDFWLSMIDTPFTIISLYEEEQQVDKLSLLIQFYLAHVSIYCAANNLSQLNFGLAFDKLTWMRWKLCAVIKKSLAEDITQVSKNIFNLINSEEARATLRINRELTENDYEEINAAFLRQYKVAMQSDHPDEFLIFLPKYHGSFVNHQGKIATSLSKAFLATMPLRASSDSSNLIDFARSINKAFDDEIKLGSRILESESQIVAIEHLYLAHLTTIKEISETENVQLGIGFINNLIADPVFTDKQTEIRDFIWQQANDYFLRAEYTKAKNCYTYALFCINGQDVDFFYYKALLRIKRILCMATNKTANSTREYEVYLRSEIGLILCEVRGLERFITTKNHEVIELYCYLLDLSGCSIKEYKQPWLVKLIEYLIIYQPEFIQLNCQNIKNLIEHADNLMDGENYNHAAILYRCAINNIITNKLWPSKIDGKELGLLNQRLGDCLDFIGKTEEAITAYDSAYEYFRVCSVRGARHIQRKISRLTNPSSSTCSTPTGTSEDLLQADSPCPIQGGADLTKSTEELISSGSAAAGTTVRKPVLYSLNNGQLFSTTNGAPLGTLAPIKTTASNPTPELPQKTRRRLFDSHSA